MPIVTAAGFAPDDKPDWTSPDAPGAMVLLPAGADPRLLAPHLDVIALIGTTVVSAGDGRGFSAARRLRALGYRGRVRLVGPLIADQWPLAREAGVDEIQIPEALAARQPEHHWVQAVSRRATPPLSARRRASR